MAALGEWRDRAQRFVDRELWLGHEDLGFPAVWGRRALQLLVIVVQGVARNQILLRASGLTYFSMLALLPLLALAFSLVGVFGVSGDLMRLVVEQLAAGVPEAQELILSRLQNAHIGGLGTVLGPLLGSAFIHGAGELTKSLIGLVWEERPGVDLILFGVVLVLVIAYMPRGLVGVLEALVRHAGRARAGREGR